MHPSTIDVTHAATPASKYAAGHPMTILLAEDSHSVRNAVRKLLERAGFNVLAAEDGIEALDIFSREREHIGVLVTDLIMPKMTGTELIQRARAIAPRLRVIITSGHADTNARAPTPADMILNKPFTAAALIAAVQQSTGPISARPTESRLP